jgi:hypothetical protein
MAAAGEGQDVDTLLEEMAACYDQVRERLDESGSGARRPSINRKEP